MPFPIIKLASLFIKQLSKPLGNAVKRKARESPRMKEICIWPANIYHWLDVNVRLKILGLGKSDKVPKLSPEAAADLGAEMIGETFLYSFAALILYGEYRYLSRGNELKEEAKKQQMLTMEHRINDLGLITEAQETQLRELKAIVSELESRNTSLAAKLFGMGKKPESQKSLS